MARLLTGLLVGGLLVGCLPGNLPTGTGRGTAGKKASPTPQASVAPTVTPSLGPGTIGGSGGLISNNGGSLTGVVRVPASLVSNNGSSWRVLATVPEAPLANVLVRLVDAKGDPLKDAEQRPLTAMTDAQGRYNFSAALPAQQILIEVVLPEGKGQLKAIAPYASGVKKADVGLISTLTTTYILEKYVKNLPDPVARLERLPASMEAETRSKTQTAFEGGTAAVPPALSAEAVVATVEQLRQQNTTLNTQLDEVKRLLLVAGQSDLGSGRPGTEVDIPNIGALVPGPGGTLYLSAPFDRRVWRLRADGILETAIGKGGTAVSPTVAGLSGPDAGLGAIRHTALDTQGRLLVVDDAFTPSRGNAFRLDSNGKLEVVWKGPDAARFVFPSGDDLLVFTTTDPDEDTMTAKLWQISPGQAPREIKAYTGKEPIYLNNASAAGLDAAGNPWFTTEWAEGEATMSFEYLRIKVDAASGAMEVVSRLGEGQGGSLLDSRAQAFQPQDNGTLKVLLPDGTTRTLTLPDEAGTFFEAVALGTDEALYLAGSGRVHRVGADGKLTRLVGAGQTSGTGAATGIAVLATALAVDAQGVLFAAELKSRQVLKVQNNQLSPLYTAAEGEAPWGLQFDPQGRLHVLLNTDLGASRIVRLDAAGQASQVYTWTPEEAAFPLTAEDFVFGKDGAVYAALTQDKALDPPVTDDLGNVTDRIRHSWVKRLPLNGFTELEIDHQQDLETAPRLAIGPDGALYIGDSTATTQRLRRWTSTGLTTLGESTDSDLMMDISGVAIDAQGRIYVTSTFTNRLLRFEAGTKTFTIIAGPGGKLLSGSGVDNSLEYVSDPVFDKDGNLYFSDETHKQIKRIPADLL